MHFFPFILCWGGTVLTEDYLTHWHMTLSHGIWHKTQDIWNMMRDHCTWLMTQHTWHMKNGKRTMTPCTQYWQCDKRHMTLYKCHTVHDLWHMIYLLFWWNETMQNQKSIFLTWCMTHISSRMNVLWWYMQHITCHMMHATYFMTYDQYVPRIHDTWYMPYHSPLLWSVTVQTWVQLLSPPSGKSENLRIGNILLFFFYSETIFAEKMSFKYRISLNIIVGLFI